MLLHPAYAGAVLAKVLAVAVATLAIIAAPGGRGGGTAHGYASTTCSTLAVVFLGALVAFALGALSARHSGPPPWQQHPGAAGRYTRPRAALVIAHPDDEAMFFGPLLRSSLPTSNPNALRLRLLLLFFLLPLPLRSPCTPTLVVACVCADCAMARRVLP